MASTESDYSYDSGSSSSSSLDFIPRFGYPSLFPYHAIGGSVDAGHYIDTSTVATSVSLAKDSNNASKKSATSDYQSLDYSIHRQQSLVGSVILSPEDIELLAGLGERQCDDDSLGCCSDLTLSTRASNSGATEEPQAFRDYDDCEAWQQWQPRFQASTTPLIEDDEKDENHRQERHRVLQDTLPSIWENVCEDVNEDEVAAFMKAIGHDTMPPAPLKRDHTLGGSPLWPSSSDGGNPGNRIPVSRERTAAWQQYRATNFVRSKTPLLCPDEDSL